MVSLIKEDEMELNIKWTEIREVNILNNKSYFVAKATNEGKIECFCIAEQLMGVWVHILPSQTDARNRVIFEVTHVCKWFKRYYPGGE